MKNSIPVKFELGDRVEVRPNRGWPNCPAGRIAHPPTDIIEMFPEWETFFHPFRAHGKWTREYWVKFDTPQPDGDGDGPYSEAAISEDALTLSDKTEKSLLAHRQ